MTASSSSRLSAVARKDLGAFYTPQALTSFGVAWAIQDKSATAMDPSCGDAAFLVASATRLRDLGATKRQVSHQIVGVDLNPDAATTAGELLRAEGVSDARIRVANFFSVMPGRDLPTVDALVGNPPYVRYQLFRDENRRDGLLAAARAGVVLPALTSAWAPFVVHASTFLRPGGRMALVLPGELLHVGYASALREYLLRTFDDLTLVTFEEKVFPGALEEVVLVLGTKGGNAANRDMRVRRLQSLDDLKEGPTAVLEKARTVTSLPGQRWLSLLLEGDALEGSRAVIERASFSPLGEMGRVDIGVVTGANDFFMVSADDAKKHRLPETVLMPAVSKAHHVTGARFMASDWSTQAAAGAPAYLVVMDAPEANGAVADYIALGEERGLPSRYKCRTRKPWFRVPYVRKPDLFLTYMAHIAPRMAVNDARATHTNTVHGVHLNDPLIASSVAVAFLNSATLLSTEMEGRSYGGGVLKVEPGEATKILLPKITTRLDRELRKLLPRVDGLVRDGKIDEASAVVDQVILTKLFKRSEIEQIRAGLAALRARRMTRGETS